MFLSTSLFLAWFTGAFRVILIGVYIYWILYLCSDWSLRNKDVYICAGLVDIMMHRPFIHNSTLFIICLIYLSTVRTSGILSWINPFSYNGATTNPQEDLRVNTLSINNPVYMEFIHELSYKNTAIDKIIEIYEDEDWINKISALSVINLCIDRPSINIILNNLPILKDASHLHIQLERQSVITSGGSTQPDEQPNTAQSIGHDNDQSSEQTDTEKAKIHKNLETLFKNLGLTRIKKLTFSGIDLEKKLLNCLYVNNHSLTALSFIHCTLLGDVIKQRFLETFIMMLKRFNYISSFSFINCQLKKQIDMYMDVPNYTDLFLSEMDKSINNEIILHIEGESECVVVTLLKLLNSFKEVSLSNNSLLSLDFLESPEIETRLSGLESFHLRNEPALMYFEPPFSKITPNLQELLLIGINPRIRVSTQFFLYELLNVETISLDAHIFEQIGYNSTLFMNNKQDIRAYGGGIDSSDTLYIRIATEVFNITKKDLCQNTSRIKVQIFSDTIEKASDEVRIILPKSLGTEILTIEVFSNSTANTESITNLIKAITSRYENIEILSVIFSSRIKQKYIDISFLKELPSLQLFSFENLEADIIFNSGASQGYFSKGLNYNVLSLCKEDDTWVSMSATPNYILHAVDVRYFSQWATLPIIYNPVLSPISRLNALPQPTFIPEENIKYIELKRQEKNDRNVLKRFVNNNKKCTSPKCITGFSKWQPANNLNSSTKTKIASNPTRYENYFMVLTCGHYICIECVEHAKPQKNTSLIEMGKSFITNPYTVVKVAKELLIRKKVSQKLSKASVSMKCLVPECINSNRFVLYNYTSEINYIYEYII
ncbi:hypothetical protein NEPAR06_0815 [Nematocida parisii]|uniref:Uncharacterized protein n=1 Tax=Nematocida parisii (strain ERTm3) TaxID=935791 RepID=I3EEK8_NEMP3|nr:uncharacterized protein NEPG_02282 [Nematocida parisii ERTm1]EIJ87655.1 hypothetical protein NEQG_02202 [Nematocida parisii ERTm3]KAI5143973.1 hypothetical protein NEPAR07_0970 [Nematocida parisii]EIJ92883.1 hypothetical protein NEPG_02282 [Nematocida parisii ERTm1]KAI5154033.1 hypothetical protein NEPAR06_0815 [Nematocida parisii]KAI5156858.1 hypothetical protein NEPAR05_0854 [Nematocida parisii]|eukprot:XP_013060109.1 hypothetical protein NEPG_02282 [Nematocida parisii ERTm1]